VAILIKEIVKRMCETSWEEEEKDLDEYVCSRIANIEDVEDAVNKFSEAITKACNKSFMISRAITKTKDKSTVPWWTQDLTISRQRVNAFRRKYQRTRNNDKLRDQCKTDYQIETAKYQAKIKNTKIQSWKQYCNKTSATNP
jgi:CHAT domain-containing protein